MDYVTIIKHIPSRYLMYATRYAQIHHTLYKCVTSWSLFFYLNYHKVLLEVSQIRSNGSNAPKLSHVVLQRLAMITYNDSNSNSYHIIICDTRRRQWFSGNLSELRRKGFVSCHKEWMLKFGKVFTYSLGRLVGSLQRTPVSYNNFSWIPHTRMQLQYFQLWILQHFDILKPLHLNTSSPSDLLPPTCPLCFQEYLCITDPDLVSELMMKQFKNFQDRPLPPLIQKENLKALAFAQWVILALISGHANAVSSPLILTSDLETLYDRL